MAMSEAHKQAVRDGIARKKALQKLGEIADGAKLKEGAVEAIRAGIGFPEVLIPDLPKYVGQPDGSFQRVPPPDDAPVSEPSPGPLPDPFVVWLRTPEGWSCADPRVPQDRVRFAVHLEDVLKKAFNAGYREGSI